MLDHVALEMPGIRESCGIFYEIVKTATRSDPEPGSGARILREPGEFVTGHFNIGHGNGSFVEFVFTISHVTFLSSRVTRYPRCLRNAAVTPYCRTESSREASCDIIARVVSCQFSLPISLSGYANPTMPGEASPIGN
jgi:hypothetical protein